MSGTFKSNCNQFYNIIIKANTYAGSRNFKSTGASGVDCKL